jgi:molybdate transport system ATP-binding protein
LSDPTPNLTQASPQVPLRPHHHLKLEARLGGLDLEIDHDLCFNWTIIFGPSGSGKTSILRAIAGLFPQAKVELTRFDANHQKHDLISLPPRGRQIAYAPQQPSLFPHLTVAENIAFPQQTHKQTHSFSKASPEEINTDINTALALFRLQPLAGRYPKNLSGGERQRVNLARAFAVPNPQLMLLDEPFSGIDRDLRETILPELRQSLLYRGIPVLSVTHDIEEAFQLQADVITLRDGRIDREGYVSKVLREERLSLLKNLG